MCLLAFVLSAQPGPAGPEYSILNVARDIPDDNVTGIVQDARGFIWIGTRSGVFRYDGIGYKSFQNGPEDERKLTFNLIRRIHLAIGRYLIVEGQRGLNILDTYTERLCYASPDSLVYLQILSHAGKYLFQFEDVSLASLLFRLNAAGTLEPVPLPFPDGIRMDRACYDGEQTIYFFDKSSWFWKADLREKTFQRLDTAMFSGRRLLRLPTLMVDDDRRIWAFDKGRETYRSIMEWTAGNGFAKRMPLLESTNLQPSTKEHELWSFDEATAQLSRIDLRTGSSTRVATLDAGQIGTFTGVLEDRQGNLWIASQYGAGQGIFLLRPHLKAFDRIFYTPGKESDLGQTFRSLGQLPDGRILAGGGEGLMIRDDQTGEEMPLSFPDLSQDTRLRGIWKILFDPDGRRIWFSREEGGLYELVLRDLTVHNYLPLNQVSDRALGLLQDNQGLIWIGTRSGITWFDPRSRSFNHQPELNALFPAINGYNWVQTDSSTIWFCSSNGLYRFDPDRRLLDRYGTDTQPHLYSNEVYDIIRQDSVYWIATDNGLHRLAHGRITRYTTDDGLPHNTIACLAADQEGRIWVSTFHGLSRFDPTTGLFLNFFVQDGLPHNEFNRLGKYHDAQGRLYFSTLNGIVRFRPEEPERNLPAHRLVLTGFSTFARDGSLVRLPEDELNDLHKLIVPAGNKYFQLDFALLNYINSEENRYTYFLSGLEDDWRPMNKTPFLQYNNLPPGRYTLHIRALSPGGRWAANTLDLEVLVKEHWYQTTWFNLMASLILLSIVSLYFRLRFMQRLNLERMRNRISSDLHDEVGGVLSGIGMQMDLLESRAPETLRPYMQRIGESSRKAAMTMRDVIWSIDAGKDHLGDLVDRMKTVTVELLSPLDLAYSFDFTRLHPQQRIPVDVRQNMYLVFKETINNIIKHSRAARVDIRLAQENNMLVLEVQDDGIGFDMALISRGHGLTNMRNRARRLNGSIAIEAVPQGGTRVTLKCPLRHTRF